MPMRTLGTLHPPPPYAFDLLLGFLSRHAYPTTDRVHHGRYRRVLHQHGSTALIEVHRTGSAQQPALTVDLLAATGPVDDGAMLNTAAYILGTDIDRRPFYEAVEAQPLLWPVIEPLYGLPAVRTPTVFEALINTIIEQQILWTAAQRAQLWLLSWAGQAIEYGPHTYYGYSQPAQLAAAAVEDLKPLKITFRRMQMMIDIARGVEAGQLDLEGLKHLSDEERYQALLSIKGIGHWTAAVTAARAFGYSRYVPDNDVGLQAAVKHFLYGQSGRSSAQTVAEAFAPLGDHAGFAAYHTLVRWVYERYAVQ
jgi:DNA-3-methyladenine glycosylase II